ncbi:unnamed protein product, partial [marine sediment metagenome]
MAKSRNDILFKYLADTKNLEQGNKRVGKSLGGVADLAKKAGGALALAFGGREIVQFAGQAVAAASDYEESINAVEVATGLASDQIQQFGKTAADNLGLSKTEVNEAAVAFAGFGEKIAGSNFGGTFEEFTTRATDFASVMNISVAESLEKFQSGLAGESEPLRRFGLDLSAASVNAFAYANGIAEAGSKLTEAEKVQARYGLLMEQTSKTAGDFANTSDSLANSQRILTANWKDAQVELGEKLLPVMQEFTKLGIKAVDQVDNFSLGMEQMNIGMRESVGFFVPWIARASDADKAMFELDRRLGAVNEKLEDGARPIQVAADLMGDLARQGLLADDSI